MCEELLLSSRRSLSNDWTFSKQQQEVNYIVHVKSRNSEKLQKMQILSANHMHVEKENIQEIFRE